MSKISLKHSGGNVVSLNSPTNAPSAADVAFKLPNADGSAGQFMKTDGSGNLSFDAVSAGITMADQWRINSAFNSQSEVISFNWERNDTDFAQIGTGMSYSSGVFSFPQTGVYLVEFYATMWKASTAVTYLGVNMEFTTDNSSYNVRAEGYGTIPNNGTSYTQAHVKYIFDVTNVSTHKVRFRSDSATTVTYYGNTDRNGTVATFIRLGDT